MARFFKTTRVANLLRFELAPFVFVYFLKLLRIFANIQKLTIKVALKLLPKTILIRLKVKGKCGKMIMIKMMWLENVYRNVFI